MHTNSEDLLYTVFVWHASYRYSYHWQCPAYECSWSYPWEFQLIPFFPFSFVRYIPIPLSKFLVSMWRGAWPNLLCLFFPGTPCWVVSLLPLKIVTAEILAIFTELTTQSWQVAGRSLHSRTVEGALSVGLSNHSMSLESSTICHDCCHSEPRTKKCAISLGMQYMSMMPWALGTLL